jgi:hypothetical protein
LGKKRKGEIEKLQIIIKKNKKKIIRKMIIFSHFRAHRKDKMILRGKGKEIINGGVKNEN